MIKGIGHLAFEVKDMDKSMDFYCNALGLKKAFDLRDEKGNPFIQYLKVSENQFIELFYAKVDKEKANGDRSYSHMCLEVDDIYKTVESIRSKGVHIDSEPVRGKDLNYQSWIRDPDGNRIELMQMDPDSPQAKSKNL